MRCAGSQAGCRVSAHGCVKGLFTSHGRYACAHSGAWMGQSHGVSIPRMEGLGCFSCLGCQAYAIYGIITIPWHAGFAIPIG